MAAVPANPITVIGAGLAGCECAHVLARLGHTVRLIDQKPLKRSAAHQSDGLAELVCSNSLRSDSPSTAIGLLHEELRKLGSVILGSADAARVPAGEALAVEREAFSKGVEEALAKVGVKRESHEATAIAQDGITIVATGPLTSDALTKALEPLLGEKLYFYDAIAPIVSADSVDSNVSFRQSRWGKGDGDDYVNLPMDPAQYKAFVDALRAGGKVTPHDFEEARYFEGCLPIEVMAERGDEVLSHGPMKPVGLKDPRTGKQPHAVVQLRHENKAGTAYNLVGFQTRLTWPEQKRIFGMIPGLQNAEWLRLGQIHRNTFIDSPRLLAPDLSLKSAPQVFFAGQITGVEGYVESAACGHLTALCVHARLSGQTFVPPPAATALGALYRHVTGEAHPEGHDYQPSNVTFGLFPPLEGRVKRADKREAYSRRAREQLSGWLPNVPTAVPSPPPVSSSLSTEVRP